MEVCPRCHIEYKRVKAHLPYCRAVDQPAPAQPSALETRFQKFRFELAQQFARLPSVHTVAEAKTTLVAIVEGLRQASTDPFYHLVYAFLVKAPQPFPLDPRVQDQILAWLQQTATEVFSYLVREMPPPQQQLLSHLCQQSTFVPLLSLNSHY